MVDLHPIPTNLENISPLRGYQGTRHDTHDTRDSPSPFKQFPLPLSPMKRERNLDVVTPFKQFPLPMSPAKTSWWVKSVSPAKPESMPVQRRSPLPPLSAFKNMLVE